jgi:hypothetical protein
MFARLWLSHRCITLPCSANHRACQSGRRLNAVLIVTRMRCRLLAFFAEAVLQHI